MNVIKKILNPIQHYGEIPLFVFGIVIAAISILFCTNWDILLDGYLDIHDNRLLTDEHVFTIVDYAAIYGLNILAMSVPMLILGFIINIKSRIIDILNSVFVTRWPLMVSIPLVYALSRTEVVEELTNQLENLSNVKDLQIDFLSSAALIVYSVLLICLLVLHIFTFFYSYCTAVHVKKGWQKVGFFIALLIGEILSKYIIIQFYF